jgi:D-lactate dehydrogenase
MIEYRLMKVSIFSTKSYDRQFFTAANINHQHELIFLEPRLDGRASLLENRQTACLATNTTAVCVFVNTEVTLSKITQVERGQVWENEI